ncbi:hypothetical protein [Ewingella americana]|uniref:hypothetical protein n=1 Tax=Ewingella americana TaxID=41202 RepID=UPI001F4FFFE1|nr:hypothetical protein [Ewingella americana]
MLEYITPSLIDLLTPRSPCGGTENVNKGNIHFFGEVIVNTLNVEIKRLGYTGVS